MIYWDADGALECPFPAWLCTGNSLLATSRISSPVRKGDVSMMAKNVRLSEKSRQKLVEGINIVANAVKVTLGPKVGRSPGNF